MRLSPATLIFLSWLLPVVSSADDLHQEIYKFLDPDTVMVGWVAVDGLDVHQLANFLEQVGGPSSNEGERQRTHSIMDALKSLEVKRIYGITGERFASGFDAAVFLSPRAKETAAMLANLTTGNWGADYQDGMAIIGTKDNLARWKKRSKGSAKVHLSSSLEKCQGTHGVVLTLSDAMQAKVVEFSSANWSDNPPMVAQIAQAVASVQSVTLTGALPPTQATLRIHCGTAPRAKALAQVVNALFVSRGARNPRVNLEHPVRLRQKGAFAEVEINSLAEAQQLIASVEGLFQNPATPAYAVKRVGLAIQNYAAVHKHFPPQSLVDKKGKRLLSWRVLILPYLDQQELYAKFRLDEPWDSTHNLKLAAQIPEVFAAEQEGADKSKTRILALLTEGSVFGRRGPPIYLPQVVDGTSNTIYFAHGSMGNAVVWTKPEDVVVDLEHPFTSIAGSAAAFYGGFVDGSTRKIESSVDADVIQKWLTFAGNDN